MEKIVCKIYLMQNYLMNRKYDKLMIGGKNGSNLKKKSEIRKNRKIFFSTLMIFLLDACQSNQIGFDPETNTVYSVDNYPIRELNIVMEKAKKSFWITKVDTLEGLPRIRLDSLGKNYKIVTVTNKMQPKKQLSNIPFVPSETYEIYHASIGDASACIIYVLTDENGMVNKVLKQYEYTELQGNGKSGTSDPRGIGDGSSDPLLR